MIPKRLDQVEITDLTALQVAGVAEGRSIDYKLALPGNSDADRRELLADISSFANTSGGDLLFGVAESQGVPTGFPGVQVPDLDQFRLTVENLVRSGLDPRLPAFDIAAVPVAQDRTVIVVRVPKSWIAPHRVSFRGHGHFYARNSAGKYQLDVGELRAAFALSEGVRERIRNFRADRIAKVNAEDSPAALEPGAKLILHVLPLSAFTNEDPRDLPTVDIGKLRPLTPGAVGYDFGINLDGIIAYNQFGYTQFFRNGRIEGVECIELGEKIYYPDNFEREILEGLPRYFELLRDLGIQPPIYVSLSLIGVRGFRFGIRSLRSVRSDPVLRDDVLAIPETIVNSTDASAGEVMQPIFDRVWNAFGRPRCENYDSNGVWRSRT